MRDYYEVLGISRAAGISEIRAAFKRLAKQYHPDRNPGNKDAEENFKAINEAYHTLSHPIKKAHYDLRFIGLSLTYNEARWQEYQQRRYYRQKYAQTHPPHATYRFDKNYFKIQGLAFLVFLIIAAFCFGIIHTAHYYVEKQQIARIKANHVLIEQANGLFGEGKFSDAFTLIENLEHEDPLEYRFGFAKDSLVNALRKKADLAFRSHDFNTAVEYYTILHRYEQPARIETLENMYLSQYYIGNYEQSLQSLKHLHNQEPYNLGLIYQIGMINLEKLNNAEEALHYFTIGKKLFKENLGEVYGAAFQIVMNPSDAPDIYYYIFVARARANMQLGRYNDAVTDCNWAVFLRRDQPEPYALRARAAIKIRDFHNVCDDLTSAHILGDPTVAGMKAKYCK
jgi:curved DNA-binding protein CbpA